MQTQASQFNYDKPSRTFSTFASDLGIRAADPLPKEIYIQGKERNVPFAYQGAEKDNEGDVTAYVYESATLWNPVKLRLWNT